MRDSSGENLLEQKLFLQNARHHYPEGVASALFVNDQFIDHICLVNVEVAQRLVGVIGLIITAAWNQEQIIFSDLLKYYFHIHTRIVHCYSLLINSM